MTTATITLNVGTGGDKPLVDTLTTVDGVAAPAGASVQMVKIGHGAASDFKTASATNPLPISGPVTGTFFQATQPVSAVSLPLPAGASTETTLAALNAKVTAVNTGAVVLAAGAATVGTVNIAAAQTLATVTTVSAVTAITNALPTGANTVGAVTGPAAAPLSLDATQTNHTQRFQAVTTLTTLSVANTTVTLTLPAVAGQFHYIARIEIVRVATAALAGTAVLAYTSTNIPGAWARSAGNAMAAGGTSKDVDEVLENPIKSTTVNTATTIVAPAAGAAVLVRITAYYYTAA